MAIVLESTLYSVPCTAQAAAAAAAGIIIRLAILSLLTDHFSIFENNCCSKYGKKTEHLSKQPNKKGIVYTFSSPPPLY